MKISIQPEKTSDRTSARSNIVHAEDEGKFKMGAGQNGDGAFNLRTPPRIAL
jgi:hypothetical protein